MTALPVGKGEMRRDGVAAREPDRDPRVRQHARTRRSPPRRSSTRRSPTCASSSRSTSTSSRSSPREHDALVTVEENVVAGGAGSAVGEALAAEGIVDPAAAPGAARRVRRPRRSGAAPRRLRPRRRGHRRVDRCALRAAAARTALAQAGRLSARSHGNSAMNRPEAPQTAVPDPRRPVGTRRARASRSTRSASGACATRCCSPTATASRSRRSPTATCTSRCRRTARARTCRGSSRCSSRAASRAQPPLSVANLRALLDALVVLLEAPGGRIELAFPYLRPQVGAGLGRGEPARLRGAARRRARRTAGTGRRSPVAVPVTSLCPCSKEISEYGAHNQRSTITIAVRSREPLFLDRAHPHRRGRGLVRALRDPEARRREVRHRARLRQPALRRGPGARRRRAAAGGSAHRRLRRRGRELRVDPQPLRVRADRARALSLPAVAAAAPRLARVARCARRDLPLLADRRPGLLRRLARRARLAVAARRARRRRRGAGRSARVRRHRHDGRPDERQRRRCRGSRRSCALLRAAVAAGRSGDRPLPRRPAARAGAGRAGDARAGRRDRLDRRRRVPMPRARREWFGGRAAFTTFQWHYDAFALPAGRDARADQRVQRRTRRTWSTTATSASSATSR